MTMSKENSIEILPSNKFTAAHGTNAALSYIASLPSPQSKRSQAQALGVIAGLLAGTERADPFALKWETLRFQHTSAIRAALIEKGYSPATINRFLVALRQTLKQAWRLGLMSAEEYERAADLKTVTGETIPAGRELSSGEMAALMTDCMNDPGNNGARDAAIIALLYSCGLRRAEAVDLDLADFEVETGRLLVRGKRAKERTVYVFNEAAKALMDWLAIRGNLAGPLFVPIRKGGRVQISRLTPQAIYYILQIRAEGANLKKSFSPHDMRRTFVSNMLAAGADITTVAQLAGHESIDTTARYDRRPEEAKRKALKLLHVPYQDRAATLEDEPE
jgi:integrase/recombinase XerD